MRYLVLKDQITNRIIGFEEKNNQCVKIDVLQNLNGLCNIHGWMKIENSGSTCKQLAHRLLHDDILPKPSHKIIQYSALSVPLNHTPVISGCNKHF